MKAWLIWSHEHKAWWKPGGLGYTKDRREAGRFMQSEAAQICFEANLTLIGPQTPDETMCPDWPSQGEPK